MLKRASFITLGATLLSSWLMAENPSLERATSLQATPKQEIRIIRGDSNLSPKERERLEKLSQESQLITATKKDKSKISLENGKRLYERDCAHCHGEKAEISIHGKPPLASWESKDIVIELRDYQLGEYEGESKFIKRTIASTYRTKEMQEIALYIKSLQTP